MVSKLILKVTELQKSFGRKKAVDNVSFELNNGVHALLGPNGSGKTTLLRCIASIYSNYKGEIVIKDEQADKSRKPKIGYLPQKFDMFNDVTIFEAMKFFCSLKGMKGKDMKAPIDAALTKVGLYDKQREKCGNLSGGMVRRIGIAQAFLNSPDIVILDEPTVGLDPNEKDSFKNIIEASKLDHIIVLSTHDLEFAEQVCDNLLIINNGKLCYNQAKNSEPNIGDMDLNEELHYPDIYNMCVNR